MNSKRLLLASLLPVLTCIFTSQAQTYEWVWESHTSDNVNINITNAVETPDGTIFFRGNNMDPFTWEGISVPAGTGFLFGSPFLGMYGNGGSEKWIKQVTCSNTGGFFNFSEITASDDNSVIALVSTSFGVNVGDSIFIGTEFLMDVDTSGNLMAFVKIDKNGDIVWKKRIQEISAQSGAYNGGTIFSDNQGGFYFSCSPLSSTYDFDGHVASVPSGFTGVLLAHMDTDGDFDWATTLTTIVGNMFGANWVLNEDGDLFASVAFESDTIFFGNVYAVNPTPGGFFNLDRAIVKFDGNGNAIWAAREGSTGIDSEGYLAPASSGGVYAMSSVGDGTALQFDQNNSTVTGPGILITKYDANGVVTDHAFFANTLANPGGLHAFDGGLVFPITFTDPGVSIAGLNITNSAGVTGTNEFAVLSIDTNFNGQWFLGTNAGTNNENFYSMKPASGGFVVAGSTLSDSLILGPFTVPNAGAAIGNTVGYMAKFANTVGVEDFVSESTLTMFPIPAHDHLSIQFNDLPQERAVLSVLSISGQTLLQESITITNAHRVNVESLSAGVYMLNVNIGGRSVTKKFIKQ